jgi:hypothetical protein
MKADEPVQADPKYRVTTVPPAVVPLIVNGVPAWGVDGVMVGVAHAPLRITENTVKLRRSNSGPIIRLPGNTHHTHPTGLSA